MPYLASIIIPTLLSNEQYLANCLLSLNQSALGKHFSAKKIQVLVVFNTDRQQFAKAQAELKNMLNKTSANQQFTIDYLCLEQNLGFTGAVNAGIEQAKSQHIILLNDDTEVDKNWLKELLLKQEVTGAEMVASKIYLSDKKTLDSQGFAFAWRGKAEALDENLKCSLSDKKDYWSNNPDLLPKNKLQEPFGPDAAAALYTKNLFEKVGLLESDFFAYLEDVDLALRARQAGMSCVLAEKAVVYHHKHATTSKQQKSFKNKQDLQNWWKIIMRRYNFKIWKKFAGLILIERGRNLKGYLNSL
ncbi:MAG: glycosyltransferase family 2 protein [Candidatus Pacebacteria bacterium]|nr:glycosyltransferase family 2 protein [Candidatus Paceibacterota bacterium]